MKLTFKISLVLSILFVILFLAGAQLIRKHQDNIILNQARVQAEALFKMLVITRQWVSENGSRVDPVPAEVTKELSDYAAELEEFRFHITSDQLVNPDNAPDDFEQRAMAKFRQGSPIYTETQTIESKRFFRYMAPLYINESCLGCHDYQGYAVGDFRGGISIRIPLNNLEHAFLANNRYFIASTIILYLSLLIIVGMLLYALVLRHLKTIKNVVSQASAGDFSSRINLATRDELQDLSEAFDMMSETIMANEKNLRNQLNKVTEKYNVLLGDLQEKNQQLESVTRFKSDILDSISHEVRTPMTKILSYSEILSKAEYRDQEKIRNQSIDVIKRSVRQLRDLFNNVLTLSRLDHDQNLDNSLVNLMAMTRQSLADFDLDIAKRGLEVTLKGDDELTLSADPHLLSLVINNLLSNAIKYNIDQGRIELEIRREKDGQAVLCVWNTGQGIPRNEISLVQNRFYRGEQVRKSVPGTGLGLAIVNRIVALHQGRLEVSSEPGSSACFTLFLRQHKEKGN